MFVPNYTYSGAGFYVSFNDHDVSIYGDVTTALVSLSPDGKWTRFLILNGDHRRAYFDLMPEGLDAFVGYFESNVDQMSKFSDRTDPDYCPLPAELVETTGKAQRQR
jgi:hypothetical protein